MMCRRGGDTPRAAPPRRRSHSSSSSSSGWSSAYGSSYESGADDADPPPPTSAADMETTATSARRLSALGIRLGSGEGGSPTSAERVTLDFSAALEAAAAAIGSLEPQGPAERASAHGADAPSRISTPPGARRATAAEEQPTSLSERRTSGRDERRGGAGTAVDDRLQLGDLAVEAVSSRRGGYNSSGRRTLRPLTADEERGATARRPPRRWNGVGQAERATTRSDGGGHDERDNADRGM